MKEKHFFTKATTFDLNYLFDRPSTISSRSHTDIIKSNADSKETKKQ